MGYLYTKVVKASNCSPCHPTHQYDAEFFPHQSRQVDLLHLLKIINGVGRLYFHTHFPLTDTWLAFVSTATNTTTLSIPVLAWTQVSFSRTVGHGRAGLWQTHSPSADRARLPFQSAGPDQQLHLSRHLCQASLTSLFKLWFSFG